MNRRLTMILLGAFVAAAGASYVVYRVVTKQLNGARQGSKVIVATRNLDVGAIIKKEDVKEGEVVGAAPADAVTEVGKAVGRGVISSLYAGEPIIGKRLAVEGSGGGFAATIPAGMRACAVKVNEVVGVAGFVGPGMRVDVIITGHPPGSIGGMKVRTLLQNIEVLSAGANFQRDNEGKPEQVPVVNLLVTPAQAELLSLAGSNETHVQLVLRNPMDHEVGKPPGSELGALFGTPEAPRPAPAVVTRPAIATRRPAAAPPAPVAVPVKAPEPATHRIEVINGSKHTEQRFESKVERP